jgi:transcriptional regulator with XRE-family HTH domain
MVSDAEKRRVGALISARRQELGWDQSRFAARVGVSRNTVSSWETGRAYPQRRAGKVEAVLGISLAGDAPDPVVVEIRDLGTRAGWTPAELDQWIALYEARKSPRDGAQRAG